LNYTPTISNSDNNIECFTKTLYDYDIEYLLNMTKHVVIKMKHQLMENSL